MGEWLAASQQRPRIDGELTHDGGNDVDLSQLTEREVSLPLQNGPEAVSHGCYEGIVVG